MNSYFLKRTLRKMIQRLAATHTVINAEYHRIGRHVTIQDNVKIKTRRLFIGDGVTIHSGCRFEFESDLFIGDYTVVKNNCFLSGTDWCYIGHNCWIGHYSVLDSIGTLFMGNNVGVGAHSQLWSHIKFGDVMEGGRFFSNKPLIIEDDVWFVGHCIVSPVRAREKSMALVGSVITKDLENNKIYAGNPAVDISDKMGEQFSSVSDEDKKIKLENYRNEFYKKNPQYQDKIEIVSEIKDTSNCQFSYTDRRYTKTLEKHEVDFIRYLFPEKAKFHPIRERDWVRQEFKSAYGIHF